MNGTTEIIPRLQFDSPLETALATNDQFAPRLLPLKDKAVRFEVKDAQGYAELGAILTEVRSIRKNEIIPLWSPFSGVVERVRDFLKMKRQAAENLCEEIDMICRGKLKTYEAAEAAAAKKEEKQVQKKDPDAQVKPNIPAVGGYRRSTTYPIKVTDHKLLLKAWLKAHKDKDKERVQFLARFIVLDEKALGAYARELQNAEEFMKQIPGVKCSKEGA